MILKVIQEEPIPNFQNRNDKSATKWKRKNACASKLDFDIQFDSFILITRMNLKNERLRTYL